MVMIKKFFKAMLFGLRESSEDICTFVKAMVALLWLPIVVEIILRVRKINLTVEDAAATTFIAVGIGMFIFFGITHCIDAIKYQEKNKCDISEAWRATEARDSEDDF